MQVMAGISRIGADWQTLFGGQAFLQMLAVDCVMSASRQPCAMRLRNEARGMNQKTCSRKALLH